MSRKDFIRFRSERVSNMEIEVLTELCNRCYNRYLKTDEPILLDLEKDGIPVTYPDFTWDWGSKRHTTYLDGVGEEGEVHGNPNQQKTDRLVKDALLRRGFSVQRIMYEPESNKKRRRELARTICDEICLELDKLGYPRRS